MKFFLLLVCVAFLAGFTSVNGKNTNNNEQQMKAVVPASDDGLTLAVSVTHKVTPTRAPKISSTSTKATHAKATSKPNNASKKTPAKMPIVADDKKVEVVSPEVAPMTAPKHVDAKPVSTEKKAEHAELKAIPVEMKAHETKPLAVTGFITQNGNIYEIDSKDGIGKIEGRQNSDTPNEHICNYGSVVVYSDLPCDSVTHVKVGKIEEKPTSDQNPVDEKQPEMMKPEQQPAQVNQNEKENLEDMKPVKKMRPNSKKPRRKNKNKLRKQQNKRRFNPRPFRQQGQNQRRSQQTNLQQKRRRQLQKRQQQTRRQQGNQRRRINNRPQYYDEYEDEAYEYGRGRFY